MIYMENIFVCLAAPLIIAAVLLKGETRRLIGFFIIGLAVCLASSYINGFIVAAVADNGYASLTTAQAMAQLTPICEEAMKAMVVFLFIGINRPDKSSIISVSFAVGLGFATFENCCYIFQYGSTDFSFALIRGFSAGATHAVCAAILGYGLALIYRRGRMIMPGAFALLCAASTFHSIYNLLAAAEGAWRAAGCILPVAGAALTLAVRTLADRKLCQ